MVLGFSKAKKEKTFFNFFLDSARHTCYNFLPNLGSDLRFCNSWARERTKPTRPEYLPHLNNDDLVTAHDKC